MTELVSRHTILMMTGGVSVVGLVCFIAWLRRREGAVAGGLTLLAALAWPLWMLFERIDDWLDTVTFRGMAAPYVVFIIVGYVVGKFVVRLLRKQAKPEP